MGATASFVAPRYERVGRGACELCSGAFSLANPACAPCARCSARLCRRCFTASCTLRTPCGVLALPFVPRAASTCDACGPESEREERFAAQQLPFLAAGALVTRVQPSLLGEATTQVLLSLVPRERALRFASMQLTAQGQQPRDSGQVLLDDVAEVRSGAAAAAGAGLQRALLGGAVAASLSSAAAGASASSSAAVAAPPYAPALVVHLVSARGRTVFVFACADERSFERWTTGLAEALALAKAKHSAVFPAAAARAAAAAASSSTAAAGAAKAAELARRQAERDAFKQRLATGAGVGGVGTGGVGAGGGPTPGTNPAALAAAPKAGELSSEMLESLGRPPGARVAAGGQGVSVAALGALARRESLAPMPISSASGAQAQAQAAQEAAASALARTAGAFRSGLAAFREALDASVPARPPR